MSMREIRGVTTDARLPVAAAAIIGAIVLTRLHGYLLFHALAETFAVVVGLIAFSIAWNTRRALDSPYLLVVGLFLGPAGVVDLLHMLAYKGMGVFPVDANLPTQLWVAARMIEVGGMAAGVLWAQSGRPRPVAVLVAALAALAVLLAAIFWWRIFPDCWREGQGLTPFKIGAEYALMAVLALVLVRLWRMRGQFSPDLFPYLAGSVAMAIATEGCFTLYTDVYGLLNMAGHVSKMVVFFLVYGGLVRFGFAKPQEILYRQLSSLNARLTEDALRSNERASLALAAADAAAWEWDMGPRPPVLTARHAEWLGTGRVPTWAELEACIAADDRAAAAAAAAPRSDPKPREATFQLNAAGQPPRWVWRVTRVLTTEDGTQSMIGLDMDVTADLAAQAERDSLHHALEASHAELRRFSEILAHHLQEPIRTQVRYTQLLMRELPGELPADAREAAQFIVDGGERLRMLLRDVQLYLALDVLPPPSAPCDSDTVLDSVWRRFGSRSHDAALAHPPLPRVVIAPERLADLFYILLENAIEYRDPDRAPAIRVTAQPTADRVEFQVADNGIGIEPEYLEKIFGVFERLHARHVHPGTGIGLALARKIVEAAGGRIWATSSPGEGTTVHFTLPLETRP